MSEYQEIDKDDNDAVAEIELPESGTVEVVGVRFREAGKVYYFKIGEETLKTDDLVIVETARGIEAGTVVVGPRQIPVEEVVPPLRGLFGRQLLMMC